MTQSKTKKPVVPNAFMNYMKVRLTFVESLLGTASSNPDVQREHVAKHAPDAPTLSEEVEAASVEEVVAKVDLEACIREWLDNSIFHGHGQWRNGGFGSFTWDELTDDDN